MFVWECWCVSFWVATITCPSFSTLLIPLVVPYHVVINLFSVIISLVLLFWASYPLGIVVSFTLTAIGFCVVCDSLWELGHTFGAAFLLLPPLEVRITLQSELFLCCIHFFFMFARGTLWSTNVVSRDCAVSRAAWGLIFIQIVFFCLR